MTVYYNDDEKGMMSIKEAFEAEIDLLVECLEEKIVDIAFKKKDGSLRIAKATTNLDIIKEIDPTQLPKTDRVIHTDDAYVRFFDVDENGWRTFYKENFVNYA